MGRLEKERAAAAAKKAAGVSSPAVESRLPSYMRQTAASVAMQKARHASVSTPNGACLPCWCAHFAACPRGCAPAAEGEHSRNIDQRPMLGSTM